MKELYRWCLFLYMTHSEIKPIIKKKVAYVQTPLIYDGNADDIKIWKDLLERTINIKRVEMGALIDVGVYGVAYLSIYYPFERFLHCPSCKEKSNIKAHDKWKYEGHRWMSKCPACKYTGEFESETKHVKNRSRVRIIRWRPQDIEVEANPWTGLKQYTYRIPRMLRKRMADPNRNRVLVETTPDELLLAVKKRHNFRLDRDQLFVFEELSPSAEDDSFPIPPLLHVFKDSWLFQTLRRAQEAISVEHILPLTVLIPSPTQGGVSPHQNYDLGTWQIHMQEMVRKWRRDPNMIYTAPFPATVENIRGDAQALNVFRDMEMVRQQIAAGLDVPIEFIMGGLNWTGASVSLRVLENLFLNMIEDLELFEQTFLVPKLRRHLRLPKITLKHQSFKMADDAQQKQIAMSLRQTNTISDHTTIDELGFEGDEEEKWKKVEAEERVKDMKKMQIEQAKVQAEVLLITTEAQIKAQEMQYEAQLKMQQKQAEQQIQQQQQQNDQSQSMLKQNITAAVDAQKTPGPNGGSGGKAVPGLERPELLGLMVETFMKGTPDSLKDQELMLLEQTNKPLARAIQRRRKLIDAQVQAITPLPEQKPPRRESSPI